jgi:hypothetical protein
MFPSWFFQPPQPSTDDRPFSSVIESSIVSEAPTTRRTTGPSVVVVVAWVVVVPCVVVVDAAVVPDPEVVVVVLLPVVELPVVEGTVPGAVDVGPDCVLGLDSGAVVGGARRVVAALEEASAADAMVVVVVGAPQPPETRARSTESVSMAKASVPRRLNLVMLAFPRTGVPPLFALVSAQVLHVSLSQPPESRQEWG